MELVELEIAESNVKVKAKTSEAIIGEKSS